MDAFTCRILRPFSRCFHSLLKILGKLDNFKVHMVPKFLMNFETSCLNIPHLVSKDLIDQYASQAWQFLLQYSQILSQNVLHSKPFLAWPGLVRCGETSTTAFLREENLLPRWIFLLAKVLDAPVATTVDPILKVC